MLTWREKTVIETALDMGFDFAEGYVERGYSLPEDSPGILFGDWNPKSFDAPKSVQRRDPGPKLARIADRLGFECEWIDEWTTCNGCNRAIRTEPTSYSWVRQYAIVGECDLLCRDCIMEDPEEYLDGLVGSTSAADTLGIDLAEFGWKEFESGESGWHTGQDDRPETMAKSCQEGHDFLFQVDGVGQFDVRFTMYVRPENFEN